MRVQTLADLVRDHQAVTGESFAAMGRRTGLSKPKIGQLADPKKAAMPRARTLEKLAHGLGIPLHIVHAAALASVGIVAPEITDPDTSLLLERYQQLSPDAQALIRDVVAAAHQREPNPSLEPREHGPLGARVG